SVRELQILRADLCSHLDDPADVIDVEPVNHAVEHHGIAMCLDPIGNTTLELEGASMGEKIVQLARRVLERQLNVIEPRGVQSGESLFAEADTRGDQIRIEPETMRFCNDFLQIIP